MKKISILFLCFIAINFAQLVEDEKKAIINVIDEAYVAGQHNLGDLSKTEKGFHPGFELLSNNNNQLTKLPIYNWLESTKITKVKGDKRPLTTCEYDSIDITGNAAVVKLRLLRDSKVIFTDYLFLYKFNEGWRIVSKIYHRH
jgi:hypothetical protein